MAVHQLPTPPSGTPPGVRARADGALTFLAGRHTGRAASDWLPRPPALTGVYDLAAEPLGFSLPQGGPVAGLAAAVVAPDSLVAVLPADAEDQALVLRGTIGGTVAGDSVRGRWAYAGRATPAWGGTFVLRRRAAAARSAARQVP